MKRFFRYFIRTILALLVLLFAAGWLFIYKVKNGFPVSYETNPPVISFPQNATKLLLFSKSTGFRHSESIEKGKHAFDSMASVNHWFLYSTEDGGVFNAAQLNQFDVVVFNNCTGRLLNEEQQKTMEDYVNAGGHWIGIHGAGDNSHHWDWYDQNLVGAKFSHHALVKHLQQTAVLVNAQADSTLVNKLPGQWAQTDEWYVFYKSPKESGFTIVCSVDGDKIDPSGNFLWMKDKGFGMGKEHPVAWYRATGKGTTFYTSMGHDASAWAQPEFVQLLENAVNKAAQKK